MIEEPHPIKLKQAPPILFERIHVIDSLLVEISLTTFKG